MLPGYPAGVAATSPPYPTLGGQPPRSTRPGILQMFDALHREALESSLIKMSVTHGPMRDPAAHRMRVPSQRKKAVTLALCLRPDNKVPMVRQDTVG